MQMHYLFGNHERMKDLERRIGTIARSGLPVLIEGASGTGKEALAELLHKTSGHAPQFTRVMCRMSGTVVYPAMSTFNRGPDLSLIYPQTRGTLFLKNVHLLCPAEQEQLLAALIQATDPRDEGGQEVTARLVSSAPESLEPHVSRGDFNLALYHRLSVYRIWLPPLRERRADIPELFDQMVRCAVNGSGPPPAVTSELLDNLMAYDWPGNLRELQNVARTYVVAGRAEEIMEELRSRSRLAPVALPIRRAGASLKEQVRGASQKLETEIILRTLEHHQWNRRRAAQTLQISYRSLLYKMKSCNLRTQAQMAHEGK